MTETQLSCHRCGNKPRDERSLFLLEPPDTYACRWQSGCDKRIMTQEATLQRLSGQLGDQSEASHLTSQHYDDSMLIAPVEQQQDYRQSVWERMAYQDLIDCALSKHSCSDRGCHCACHIIRTKLDSES